MKSFPEIMLEFAQKLEHAPIPDMKLPAYTLGCYLEFPDGDIYVIELSATKHEEPDPNSGIVRTEYPEMN